MQTPRFFVLARKAVVAWIDDYAPSMGAAIAYYTMFSLAPLLVIVIVVIAIVLLSLLFWIAPNVKQPRFRWLTLGGAVALVKWRDV